MTIAPLPVRTRLYHGENLDSYLRRHAARNFCVPSDVDRALRERGVVRSKHRRNPDRRRHHSEYSCTAERHKAFQNRALQDPCKELLRNANPEQHSKHITRSTSTQNNAPRDMRGSMNRMKRTETRGL